ncbi:MAG: radical SAM protein [Gemmatimonadota bacterium]
MRRLRITVVDLTTERPTRALYARLMNANLASIMPQVIAVWCEQAGHDVNYVCYTGFEDLEKEVLGPADVVFIGAFTQAAHTAYAISNLHRSRGAVTVLGGPHARCYPQDSARHFDYVMGFTTREMVEDVLREREPRPAGGVQVSAPRQPQHLPGVQERWKFIEATLDKTPVLKIVPMIGSLGCPYTCAFCIDSTVPYQPLGFDQMKSDLRFVLSKMKHPRVGWHDPNFGVRFDDYLGAIEEVVPPGSIDFMAESSLSLLSEPHLQRLRKNGFKVILPGIESWFALGNKAKTGRDTGMEKVRRVADHINMVMRYIPYVQTNFVLGLDTDEGDEPFELTKRFVDLAPGAFPVFSLLSAFGRAAPLNLALQREGRVLPFPFHFLDASQSMNVVPRNYAWHGFYERLVDLEEYAYSASRIGRRFLANRGMIPKLMNVVRGISSERMDRVRHHARIRDLLRSDPEVHRFHHRETQSLPAFYKNRIREDLGVLWEALPDDGLHHDHHAYLRSEATSAA